VYHARHLWATHKSFNIQGGILFMKLSLIRSMTRSAVFELENGLCYRPAHPFTVQLNGETVYTACETNVFSLFSLLPGTPYTVAVEAEGETLTLDFTTEAETFFVDASRYGLVADGTTDNTGKLQAALSTCPKGGTVYVPAGRYRTSSLFMKSCTTLYLEKGAVLLGDNDRTHYPILPGVIPSENEVDEYYLTGWEGNPLDSFAGLLNITQVHDVVVTGEGTLDCDAQNGDWWINQKVKRIAWRPRAVAAVDSENVRVLPVMTDDKLCMFSDTGTMYQVKVAEFPALKMKDKGIPIENVSKFDGKTETLLFMLPASGLAGKKFLFATSQASVKIVPGEEFMTANKTVVATKLAEDDKLVEIREICTEVDGERDVVLQTVDGMFLKFPLAEIPELKKNSRGVRGIRLEKEDTLEHVYLPDVDGTAHYKGKEVALGRLKAAKRDGKGTKVRL